MNIIAESGIANIGQIPWGSHFCQLYTDSAQLAQVLVPYFVAGLVNHERCIWVTAQPYGVEQAAADLGEALPEYKGMKTRGQITICGFEEWYLNAELSRETAVQRWWNEEKRALRNGYKGLRFSGNTSFVDQRAWGAFMDYEQGLQDGLHGRRVIALCSYQVSRFGNSQGDSEILRNHHFGICRRCEAWKVID